MIEDWEYVEEMEREAESRELLLAFMEDKLNREVGSAFCEYRNSDAANLL